MAGFGFAFVARAIAAGPRRARALPHKSPQMLYPAQDQLPTKELPRCLI